jgi:hypothetical protein
MDTWTLLVVIHDILKAGMKLTAIPEVVAGHPKLFGMRLSRQTDRLPAISGLVARFQLLLPDDQYLAGIWEQGLVRELCWYPADSMESSWPPLTVDLILSWSRASYARPIAFMDLPVGLQSRHYAKTFERASSRHIDQAAIFNDGMDSFELVTGGCLTIRTLVRDKSPFSKRDAVLPGIPYP